MDKYEKEHGFTDLVKGGLNFISKIVFGGIFPTIAEGAEIVMKNIDDSMALLGKRILRRVYSSLIIGFGIVFLAFALFFYTKESLGWSNATVFFSIGIIVFVIGLLLKVGENNK